MSDADRRIAAGLFVLTFVAYAWFFGGGGWNQNAHFDLTRAIVERGTFAIDPYHDNTYDIAFHAGHVYANKAPGVSLLAVPAYAAASFIERSAGIDVNSPLVMTVNLWLCTVMTCAITGALIPPLLFSHARRRLAAVPRDALALALATAFGTYLFAYSTVLFAHVPSALFLFWSFVRLSGSPDERPWIAGLLAGAAGLCNYLCIPAAVVLISYAALVSGRRVRRVSQIVAGAAVFAVVLLLYQWAVFGSPLRTSIEAESGIFKQEGAILGVLTRPRLEALIGITTSPFRGLLFLSPFLVAAVPGAVAMFRRRNLRLDLAAIAAVAVIFVGINICFNKWDGGSGIGPRYILPVVPFLAVAIAAFDWVKPWWVALAIVSVALNFAVAAVNPIPSRTIRDPIGHYTFPLLLTGRLPADTPPYPPLAWKQSLGHVSVNRHSVDQFVPFMKHAPGSRESEWASFNLGEVVAEGSVLSLLPILFWIGGGSAWLLLRCNSGESDERKERRDMPDEPVP